VTIPLANTTITIRRRNLTAIEDPADPAEYPAVEWATIAIGVRAVIAPPTANTQLIAGDRVAYGSTLRSDPCDMKPEDHLIDAKDGTEWTVLWCREFDAIGLNHMEAQLRMVTGYAS
jgi:hypothetical protein